MREESNAAVDTEVRPILNQLSHQLEFGNEFGLRVGSVTLDLSEPTFKRGKAGLVPKGSQLTSCEWHGGAKEEHMVLAGHYLGCYQS